MQSYVLLMEGVRADIRQLPERPPHIPHKYVEWYPLSYEHGETWEGIDGDRYVIRNPDPATLPPQVPLQVSPRQARLALLAIGKLDQANAAAHSAGDMVRISWEYSSYIRRDDPGVIALASSIGIDSEELDSLFIEAAQL